MASSNTLEKAEQYCAEYKHRFTEPRRRVLAFISGCKQAVGAYQVLEALSTANEKINPPTVYRAIEFWSEHGFIHRIESKNAYIACCEQHHHENFCIFICDDCDSVHELKMTSLPAATSNDLKNKHLKVARTNTELHGKCGRCA